MVGWFCSGGSDGCFVGVDGWDGTVVNVFCIWLYVCSNMCVYLTNRIF